METLDYDSETVGYDESTTLALLDIISFLILESDFEKTSLQYFQTCLKHGERLVASLMDEDSEAMKSRSFARWLVAKAAVISCCTHDHPFSSFKVSRFIPRDADPARRRGSCPDLRPSSIRKAYTASPIGVPRVGKCRSDGFGHRKGSGRL
ncbi:hypothetical protein F5Y16DRAFT_389605 [Xylariaceae sp. FL0255]|nr:hypothetical protein F5Y16DRAFT_389605 [Xylariaceae sp. FL0255]